MRADLVEEVAVGGVEELLERFAPRRDRLDLRQAPLLRLCVAFDAVNERWLVLVSDEAEVLLG